MNTTTVGKALYEITGEWWQGKKNNKYIIYKGVRIDADKLWRDVKRDLTNYGVKGERLYEVTELKTYLRKAIGAD